MKSILFTAMTFAFAASSAFAVTSAATSKSAEAGKAPAAAPALKPGAWEVTVDVHVLGKKTPEPRVTNKQCVVANTADPAALLAGRLAYAQGCKLTHKVAARGPSGVELACDMGSSKISGTGTYLLTDTTFIGSMKIAGVDSSKKGAEGHTGINVKMNAKRTGDCN